MATHGIHGNLLEVTVVSCNKLKDTEWLSRQDPYVCVEYGSSKSRTRTCTDGGKNPTFQEKFVYTLIEGLRELNVNVWNSNTIKHDDFIGSGKVQLAKAISQGFDDSTWPLQSKTGRHAGEVRLIIHYSSANVISDLVEIASGIVHKFGQMVWLQSRVDFVHKKPAKPAGSHGTAVPPHSAPQASLYSAPPQAYPSVSYPSAAAATPYAPPAGYPAQSPYPSYPPNSGAYPPSAYPPNSGAYPPSPYPPQAPPYGQPYPPNPAYPPQPYGSQYPPGPPYPGTYPPPY